MSEDTEARPSLPDEPTEPSSPLLSPLLDADSPAPRGWPAAAIWTTIILVVLCLSAVAILALGLVGSKQSDDSQGGLAGIFRRTYGEPSSSREARGQLTELARKDLTTALEHADDGDFSLARDATERAKALLSVVKTLKPKDTPPEVALVDTVLENLEKRLAGTFEGTALSNADPAEVDLIQNGGFEEINPNSDAKRSRWLWWEGWDWGGDYENFWAEAPNVHSGRYAAGIRCTGQKGRIGIFTPQLPILPGVQRYDLTLWAKGEGDNELFINFESGCTGTLRQRVPEEWTEIQLTGEPEPGAQGFGLYLYVTGEGTIYLDDVKLVPVGGEVGE